MVERLHRQLKAAIACHTSTHWSEALPLVLLGIRSAWKEDLQASAAELVYGEPLRLPGQFFTPSKEPVDVTDFAGRLRSYMSKLAPQPTAWHSNRLFYLPKDLQTSSHVFLRQGPARRPLQPAYTGPHRVIKRRDKTYDIDVSGKEVTVTLDRLKPAYVMREEVPAVPAPIQDTVIPPAPEKKTKSGRVVRFPDYYRP
ncbi:uncharacterized protein LOC133525211 [Cydia pomonella]|uniref:uncharacterized protein LOC133525211 n=1 Tax=Cydia pomonella TaxID=82600 RepID=UPI002ADD5519|nr:uncharacterized protein LOC133525211 [Cydia pomonella]